MKIAIVGTSESAKEAPFKDDSWQIWTLGRNHIWIPRFDKWFELHSLLQLEKARTQAIYYQYLHKIKDKLYTNEPLFEGNIFPKEDIKAKFGEYFTSSIAWMFGYALTEGATEIGIWGVDMRGENEYAHQRPCLERWIGRAEERGIKVLIHHTSALLKGQPYPEGIYYDVSGMAKEAKAKADKARDDAYYADGYSDALNHIKRTFG